MAGTGSSVCTVLTGWSPVCIDVSVWRQPSFGLVCAGKRGTTLRCGRPLRRCHGGAPLSALGCLMPYVMCFVAGAHRFGTRDGRAAAQARNFLRPPSSPNPRISPTISTASSSLVRERGGGGGAGDVVVEERARQLTNLLRVLSSPLHEESTASEANHGC